MIIPATNLSNIYSKYVERFYKTLLEDYFIIHSFLNRKNNNIYMEKVTSCGSSLKVRILVLESWALYGKRNDGINAIKGLLIIGSKGNSIIKNLVNEKIKNISLNAKNPEVKKYANGILLEKNKIEPNRVYFNLNRAKDLIEK